VPYRNLGENIRFLGRRTVLSYVVDRCRCGSYQTLLVRSPVAVDRTHPARLARGQRGEHCEWHFRKLTAPSPTSNARRSVPACVRAGRWTSSRIRVNPSTSSTWTPSRLLSKRPRPKKTTWTTEGLSLCPPSRGNPTPPAAASAGGVHFLVPRRSAYSGELSLWCGPHCTLDRKST